MPGSGKDEHMANTEFQRLRRLTKNANGEIGLTPEQKTAWAEHQIHHATLGNIDSIVCPYCGSSVVIGVEGFCCKPMGDVATALLERTEAGEPEEKHAPAPSCATAGKTVQ
jgi:hypothetical protein